jgi:hypothetical protein
MRPTDWIELKVVDARRRRAAAVRLDQDDVVLRPDSVHRTEIDDRSTGPQ